MNKTDIDWCDMSWNPVTGCLHGCGYCYARGIARRFRGNGDLREDETGFFLEESRFEVAPGIYDIRYPLTRGERPEPCKKYKGVKTPYPFGFAPTFHRYRLDEPARKRKPQTIFVGSMCDLFGEWIPDEWIKAVFDACTDAPQHRYLFLTKNPDRYYQLGEGDSAIIPNGGVLGWFGASATTEKQAEKAYENLNCAWMSLEPLHGEFSEEFFVHDNRYTQDTERRWTWIVVGAETGNRKCKITPQRSWLEAIVQNCIETKTPLFMKNSLSDIWGEALIQEYPWEVK